jgi:hypothetical protein
MRPGTAEALADRERFDRRVSLKTAPFAAAIGTIRSRSTVRHGCTAPSYNRLPPVSALLAASRSNQVPIAIEGYPALPATLAALVRAG